MTFNVTVPPAFLPAMPSGITPWYARIGNTGDATGGTAGMFCDFTGMRSGWVYLSKCAIQSEVGLGAQLATLKVNGFGDFLGAAINPAIVMNLDQTPLGNTLASRPSDVNVGVPCGLPRLGATAQVAVNVANTNGAIFRTFLYGFIFPMELYATGNLVMPTGHVFSDR